MAEANCDNDGPDFDFNFDDVINLTRDITDAEIYDCLTNIETSDPTINLNNNTSTETNVNNSVTHYWAQDI